MGLENKFRNWFFRLECRSLISEGDSGVPHIRLPGPVIAQLDDDDIPEVIFTAPEIGMKIHLLMPQVIMHGN